MLRIRQVSVEKLIPWRRNPRRNEHAVRAVAKSISEFGFNVPILCDEEYSIIAGHTRLEAVKCLGMEKVPTCVLALSGKERTLFAIADNKTGELSDWDSVKLADLLDELGPDADVLKSLGFSRRELRRMLGEDREVEDTIPTAPQKPISKNGTSWSLGGHRLLCGDSRFMTTVARLMKRQTVDLVFAGPPYFNQRGYSYWKSYPNYLEAMNRVVRGSCSVLKDGGIVAWNVGNGCTSHHALVAHHSNLLEQNDLRFVDMIIWSKPAGNYGVRRHLNIKKHRRYYPSNRWEAVLIYQKPGDMPEMSADAARYMWEHPTDVWEIPAVRNQERDFGHPAVCPVEIPFRALQAYTPDGGTVLEPFGGSGSTLIAAEQSGRNAFVIEKQPQYCDQIRRRWENLTEKRSRRQPTR